jgi:hypothetical protein
MVAKKREIATKKPFDSAQDRRKNTLKSPKFEQKNV